MWVVNIYGSVAVGTFDFVFCIVFVEYLVVCGGSSRALFGGIGAELRSLFEANAELKGSLEICTVVLLGTCIVSVLLCTVLQIYSTAVIATYLNNFI